MVVIKTKAVSYARVSSVEQEKEGFSISAQQDLLRSYAEKNNIQIVKEFAEAVNLTKTNRLSQCL